MKIRMTADSTCDLTPELIRKYNIGIAPLSVIIDGEVFHDGVDVSPRDIFRAAEAGKSVRTAAVNTYEYREFFTEQMKSCDQIVHVCLSSEFSTSYADAVEAAREMKNVFVVDSRNLSTGSGLLVLEGLRMMREEGAEDGAVIAEALRAKTGLVNSSFVLRTVKASGGLPLPGCRFIGGRLAPFGPWACCFLRAWAARFAASCASFLRFALSQ